MSKIKSSENGRKAIFLGGICTVAYLAVYVVRNILSAVTPQMLESGLFTTEQIGSISSAFFVSYAVGQLINGILGDKLKATHMMSFGLIFAGLCNILFAIFPEEAAVTFLSYTAMGFFLSMIFAPMTRLVSENMPLNFATRCSIAYNVSSYLGSPIAGALAAFLIWNWVFHAGSVLLLGIGALCLILFAFFEKRGIITQKEKKNAEKEGGSIKTLFDRHIVKFTFVSILTGIIRTSVVFWMPTYFSQKLGFSADVSAGIFSVATLGIALNAFVAIIIYKKLKENMNLTLFVSFALSTVFFILLYLVENPIFNVVAMVLAILTSNCAATMLWSIYCPSLADTGLVSSATGFLDFVSYLAAAVSSSLFGNAVSAIGWNNLILVWFAMMALGTLITVPLKKKAAK